MTELEIVHNEAEGTLLEGTSRGDGAGDLLRGIGWRWSRGLGLWFVPRSRDAAPRRDLIQRTADALSAAGFAVVVRIDAAVGDRAEAQGRRDQRAADRAAALTQRAEREQHKADASWAASRRIADQIPFGQPILLGHHSQRSAERDAAMIRRQMDASVEHAASAAQARRAAAIAASDPSARRNPVTVARRIERLAHEVRRSERTLQQVEAVGAQETPALQQLRDRLAIAKADLEYWQQVRREQIAEGGPGSYGPQQVRVGDQVKIRGHWRHVVACNPKSVAVVTEFGRRTAPWHEIQEHQPAAGDGTSHVQR